MADSNYSPGPPGLVLLSGLPGSGKTTFARALAALLPFDHFESDAIRRSLAATPSYAREESARVFAIIEANAGAALRSGRHALVDATNLTRGDRRRFVRLADQLDANLVVVRLTAPESEIRRRLAAPRTGYSGAGIEVYEAMLGRAQGFATPVVVVDTRFDPAPALALVLRLVQQ